MLMNSPFVTKRVRPPNGSRVEQLVKSAKTNEEIVDELYLATLSRPAAGGEAAASVARGGPQAGGRRPHGAC